MLSIFIIEMLSAIPFWHTNYFCQSFQLVPSSGFAPVALNLDHWQTYRSIGCKKVPKRPSSDAQRIELGSI
jgi:hypothetical protein